MTEPATKLSPAGFPRPVKTYHKESYDRIDPTKTKFDAKGKTIFITGGGSGIGFEICLAFAAAGVARIAMVGRRLGHLEKAKKEIESKFPSTKVLIFSASITDYARTNEIIKEVGKIDVLVSNATVTTPEHKPAGQITIKEWEDVYAANVLGPINLYNAFLTLSTPTSGGSEKRTIINITSAAVQITLSGGAPYGSSKAAFAQISQHFALDEKDNANIITVHPGTIRTETAASYFPEDAFDWEDIALPANFTVWAASPEAAFLSGRFVWAQWDVDDLIGLKEHIEQDPTFLKVGLVQQHGSLYTPPEGWSS